MIPYFILILVPLLFSCFWIKKSGKTHTLCIESNEKNKASLAVPVFFIILFLLLALRDETIGRDLIRYKYYFQKYSGYSFNMLFYTWKESFFKWTDWFIGKYTSDYQVYLAIIAVIEVAPIAYVYCKNSTHGYLKIILFVNMSTFVMLFSGLRQSIAMALGMIAYVFVKKRKPLSFLVFATSALLFHHSGFMVFLMYPVYYYKLKKKHLIIIIPAMLGLLLFNKQVFAFITSRLADYSEKYDASVTSTGAFGSLILFTMLLIFAYVIGDENKFDAEAFGLRNFLALAVAIQCFVPLNFTAMRLNYYYILFIPLAIGKCLDFSKREYKKIADFGEIVMCAFLTFYFIYKTYDSYQTGISALDTVPYVPFWK